MDLGQHAGFIVGAYAFTALVIGCLVIGGLLDQRAQKRALASLQGESGERLS
ncbi:heme exporter protein CcmD [Methylobacterium sp. C25]|uniref:heme exporter protein CcmD n=1 Tax=Methylobacterium sp. C25 TaxID=2721622 RepID=UPI001F202A19|nr:heme exporter protein CcmD [Methylobacterium sp. C25]MCE4226386.1 heme exporter protein CcmD [Methylobacterium sp. C25]